MTECAVREALEETGIPVRNWPNPDGRVYRCGRGAAGQGENHDLSARQGGLRCWFFISHSAGSVPPACHTGLATLPGAVRSTTLDWPVPIAAADSLVRDADGRLAYHYALVDYACVPEDPMQEPGAGRGGGRACAIAGEGHAAARAVPPRLRLQVAQLRIAPLGPLPTVPSDDVDAAAWLPVASLRRMEGLVPKCAEIAEEAVRRHNLAAASRRI